MIRGFRDRTAEALFRGEEGPGLRRLPTDIRAAAKRKLVMLAAAGDLKDLTIPPGNRLEALKGKLAGRHSIRINDRWRVVFRWSAGHADDVEITDYR